MFVYSLSFTLYNLSIVAYYAVYLNFELQGTNESWNLALVAWTVTTYTNFFAELCLIWIALQFRIKAKDRSGTQALLEDVKCSVVRIEEFDAMLPMHDDRDMSKAQTASLLESHQEEPEVQHYEDPETGDDKNKSMTGSVRNTFTKSDNSVSPSNVSEILPEFG
jgi:hypothetical protein